MSNSSFEETSIEIPEDIDAESARPSPARDSEVLEAQATSQVDILELPQADVNLDINDVADGQIIITLPEGDFVLVDGVLVPLEVFQGEVAEIEPAAGPATTVYTLSGGGSGQPFELGDIGPAISITDLLPPTELSFTSPEQEELSGDLDPDIDGEKPTLIVIPDVPADPATVDGPVVNPVDTSASETALPGGSNPDSDGEAATGDFNIVTDMDALASVVVDGVDVTSGGTINGTYGDLVVTVDANGNYEWVYTLNGNTLDHNNPDSTGSDEGVRDEFSVIVTDTNGETATDVLTVNILDDGPTAVDDRGAQDGENTPVTVDAYDNDTPGADGVDIDGGVNLVADSLTGAGELVDNGDGTFSYTPGPGEEGNVSFQYTITDGDGDTSTATVTIGLIDDSEPTIEIVADMPSAGAGDTSVDEEALAGGSNPDSDAETTVGTFDIDTGGDALASLVIDGVDVTAGGDVVGDFGTLTVTLTDGIYDWSYTLAGNTDGDTTEDTFAVVVTDQDGDTDQDLLIVDIVDDVPVAEYDTGMQMGENAPVVIDVFANDTAGADGVDLIAGVTIIEGTLDGMGVVNYNEDGTFTYTPSPGEEGEVTFNYRITDGDGDSSAATVTITLNGDSEPTIEVVPDDPSPTEGVDADVDEAALPIGSDPDSDAETTTGTFNIDTGDDALGTLVIDGVDVTNGGTVEGAFGTLTVTEMDGDYTWSYTLNENTDGDDTQDEFEVVVTDEDGDEASDTLTIAIEDDAPMAEDDSADQTDEGAPVTVDVFANDTDGADGVDLDAGIALVPDSLTGTGMLADNGDGTFTYTPGVGEEGVVTFQYEITDGDGDTDTAIVTINLNGDSEPTIEVVPDDPSPTEGVDADVDEAALPIGSDPDSDAETTAGTFNIDTGDDALGTLVIDGVDVTNGGTVEGEFGTLTVTEMDGDYTWSYTLNENTDGDDTQDMFDVVVTDEDGDEASDTLTIAIEDDAPMANPDTDTIAAGDYGPAEGNTITDAEANGDNGADVMGADGALITGVAAGDTNAVIIDDTGVGVSVQGDYGVLVLGADGSYSYTRDPESEGGVDDIFTYTLTDGDGDSVTTTLTISIEDSGVMVVIPQAGDDGSFVDEAGLPARPGEPEGSNAASDTETTNGIISFTAADGPATVTINGAMVTAVDQMFTTDTGILTITAINDGSIEYSYTLSDNTDGDATSDTFDIVISDQDDDIAAGALTIDIIDDAPIARPDTDIVSSGEMGSGNVITDASAGDAGDTDMGADTVGADDALVTGVVSGTPGGNVSGNVGMEIETALGTLTLQEDGSYTYEANPNVTGVDVFTYTLTDGDNDMDTTTIEIVVTNGEPVAEPEVALVDEAALDEIQDGDDLAPGTVTGTLGTMSDAETVSDSVSFSDDDGDTVTVTGVAAGDSGGMDVSGDVGTIITGTNGVLQLNADGSYTYTLTSNSLDHTTVDSTASDGVADVFSYTVTDEEGNTSTQILTVEIADDVPIAHDDCVILTADDVIDDVNLAFVLDMSSSISSAEYGQMIDGLRAAGADLFAGATGDVSITLLAFASDSTDLGTVTTLAEFNALLDMIDPRVFGGQRPIQGGLTSFEDAVQEVMDSFALDAAANNQIFFLSDGNPTIDGDDTTPGREDHLPFEATLNLFSTFLNANAEGVQVGFNGIAIGNDIDIDNLNFIDLDGEMNTVFAADFQDLRDNILQEVVEGAAMGGVPGSSGNVVTGEGGDGVEMDWMGADGFASIEWADASDGGVDADGTIVGQYGTLVVGPDGSYTYMLDTTNPAVIDAIANGTELLDSFAYTVFDGDGDSSSATLDIKLNGVPNGEVELSGLDIVGGEVTVDEDGLADGTSPAMSDVTQNGSFSFTTPDGADDVTIDGVALITDGVVVGVGSTIVTPIGTLTITDFMPTLDDGDIVGGTFDYNFTLDDNTLDHGPGDNGENALDPMVSFEVIATDTDGDSDTDTLDINVIDDVPEAADDSGYTADAGVAIVIGDAIDNDVFGADGPAAMGSVSVTTQGAQGTVTYDDVTGEFTYTPGAMANGVDSFTYTITDADGDTSTATVSITINGSDGPDIVDVADAEVDEDGLVDANPDTPTANELDSTESPIDTQSVVVDFGDFVPADLDAALVLNDSPALDGQLTSSGVPVTFDLVGGALVGSADGTEVIRIELEPGATANGTEVTYNYTVTLSQPVDHPQNDFEDILSLTDVSFTATDAGAGDASGTIDVAIADDIPVAHDDCVILTEDDLAGDLNLAFVLDMSSSINSQEYGQMIDGLRAAGNDLFNVATGEVAITLLAFASDSTDLGTVNTLADFNALLDAIDPRVFGGQRPIQGGLTSFEDAVQEVMDSYDLVGGANNQIFFLSDGNPTIDGDDTTPGREDHLPFEATLNAFATFLNANAEGVQVGFNGIAIGNDIDIENLNFIDLDGDMNSVAATDFLDLRDNILQEVVEGASMGGVPSSSGNVVTGDGGDGVIMDWMGADGFASIEWADASEGGGIDTDGTIVGLYGTLTVDADGNYTYVLDTTNPAVIDALANDTALLDSFSYTVFDGDGDTSTADLDIKLNGVPNEEVELLGLDIDGGEVTVDEDDLADGSSPDAGALSQDGSFGFNTPDGADDVTIDGIALITDGVFVGAGTVIMTDVGDLTITGFTPVTSDGDIVSGTFDYNFTLDDNTLDHGPDDNGENALDPMISFEVIATDTDGDSDTDSLDINVVDDVPEAVADTESVTEGGTLNIPADGVLDNDILGADDAVVTGVRAAGMDTTTDVIGGVGAVIDGEYGTLILQADGSYSYVSDPDSIMADVQDVFVYTIVDGDGDLSTTTLTIDVNDAPLVADNAELSVDEAALDTVQDGDDLAPGTATGSNPADTGETVTGMLIVAGDSVTFTPISETTDNGVFELNADGSYTYTLTTPVDTTPDADNGAQIEAGVDVFNYTATDANGNSVDGTITVDVVDDVPTVTLTDALLPRLTTDDSDIADSDSGNLAAYFDVELGADGGAVDYALELSGADIDSGLVDTLTGEAVILNVSGDVITGTAGIGGDTVFTVTLDPMTGDVTLDQVRSVQHNDDADPEETGLSAATLDAGSIALTATATDGDGDVDSASVDISGNFAFEDDGPTAGDDGPYDVETDTPLVITDAFDNDAFGNDGPADMDSVTVTDGAQGTVTYNEMDGSFTYTPNMGANGLDSFTYTITDGDGDTATATVSVNIDSVPTITGLTPDNVGGNVTVDEDDLSDGSSPDAGALTQSGTFTVTSPDGIASLEIGGATVITNGVFTATTITTPLGNELTISAFDPMTGEVSYSYELLDNETHPDAMGENSILETFAVTVEDPDGDMASDDLTVAIIDDVPDVAASDEDGPTITTDDTDIPDSDMGDLSTLFDIELGADGGTVDYALALNGGMDVDSGLVDVATGDPVILNISGDVITGTAGVGGDTVFTITLDPMTGNVTLDQVRAITHDDAADPIESGMSAAVLGANLIGLTATATDSDGDTDSDTVDISGNFAFEDDGPDADVDGNADLDNLLVDETDLSTDAVADFADNFASPVDYGSDGAGSVAYTLALSADGIGSGLFAVDNADTSDMDGDGIGQGDEILLSQVGNVITGSANGTDFFTITVDAVTGEVTFDQLENIWHADTMDANDGSTLTLGMGDSLSITQTVTDRDGDSDAASLELGAGVFTINDDGPSIAPSSADAPVLVVDDTTLAVNDTGDFSSVFTSMFGEDGAGDIDYALVLNGGMDVDSGLVDVASGQAVVLNQSGDVITGTTETGGDTVLTITLGGDGSITLDQVRAIEHDNPADAIETGAEAETFAGGLISLEGTVTDADGDTATGSVDITDSFTFEDDGPSVTLGDDDIAGDLTVDDTTLGTDAMADFSSLFTAAFGEDGPADTDSLVYELGLVGGMDVDSGLVDVESGESVVLNISGDTITGTTSVGGETVLTITLGAGSTVTLDQVRAVEHDDPMDPVESGLSAAMISSGLVTLTATATDADGDSASLTEDISGAFAFEDDGPSTTDDGTFDVEANTAFDTPDVIANDDFGADGEAAMDAVEVTTDGMQGTAVYNGDGTFTYTPNMGANGIDTFEYTITDGDGDTATATVTVDIDGEPSILDLSPDNETGNLILDEENLADGSNPDAMATTQSDTFTIDSPDGVESLMIAGTAIITGGTFTATTITTPLGNELTISAYDPMTGEVSYSYELLDNEMHPDAMGENTLMETFSVAVSDPDGDVAMDDLTVAIIDDIPTANDDCDPLQIGTFTENLNIAFVLDMSSTINSTEYSQMIDALQAAGNQLFGSTTGTVSVTLTAFASDSEFIATVTSQAQFDAILDSIDPRVFGGQRPIQGGLTNFEAAIDVLSANYVPDTEANNQIFFLSDGNPTTGGVESNDNLPSDAQLMTFADFLNMPGAEVSFNGIAIGDMISPSNLDYIDVDGEPPNTVTVDNFDEVLDSLVEAATFAGGSTDGNVLTGEGVKDGGADQVGADNPVAIAWDDAKDPGGVDNDGEIEGTYGTLTVQADGSYQYTLNPDHPDIENSDSMTNLSEVFTYTITDSDGDTSSAELEIQITGAPDPMMARAPNQGNVKSEDLDGDTVFVADGDKDLGQVVESAERGGMMEIAAALGLASFAATESQFDGIQAYEFTHNSLDQLTIGYEVQPARSIEDFWVAGSESNATIFSENNVSSFDLNSTGTNAIEVSAVEIQSVSEFGVEYAAPQTLEPVFSDNGGGFELQPISLSFEGDATFGGLFNDNLVDALLEQAFMEDALLSIEAPDGLETAGEGLEGVEVLSLTADAEPAMIFIDTHQAIDAPLMFNTQLHDDITLMSFTQLAL